MLGVDNSPGYARSVAPSYMELSCWVLGSHTKSHTKMGTGRRLATSGDEERELTVSRANSWISKYEEWHPWLKRFKAARDAASGDGPLLDFLVDSGVDPDQIVAPLIELRERLAQIENFGPTSSTEPNRTFLWR